MITCLIAVYVNDILIAGNKAKIDQIKKMIKNKFEIKEIGEINFIIGIKFVKHKGGYFLNQESYANDIFTKYGLSSATPIRNITSIENLELRKKKMNETTYRSTVGSLLYLGICTRPDILYAVSKAA
jgi:hypothetical protein